MIGSPVSRSSLLSGFLFKGEREEGGAEGQQLTTVQPRPGLLTHTYTSHTVPIHT